MPGATRSKIRRATPLPVVLLTLATGLVFASVAPEFAAALGEATRFDVRGIDYRGGNAEPRPSAPRRLAWEVRKRTSIETRLTPSRTNFAAGDLFDTPFVYWAGDAAFDPLSSDEVSGLRRFVTHGGFVLIDDARPDQEGFDNSVRRELRRAFPSETMQRLPDDHTIYRSFYLLDRPVGRVEGRDHLLGLSFEGRAAVVYSRHDLGGALARDNLGTWEHQVEPGGDVQRERAMRLGVNMVMYALCLDYKDDQVHAPFIMRRRPGTLP